MTAEILHFESPPDEGHDDLEYLAEYLSPRQLDRLRMEAAVVGGPVRPHVQAFADAVEVNVPGHGQIGTYNGHDPSIDLALDVFASKSVGDLLAAWAVEQIERFAIDYVIWWQRIYNPEVAPYWRDMADRGSVTQNHKDHVHLSFEPSGPTPPIEEDDMFTDEDRALLRDVATGLAEWKAGALPSPVLDAIQHRLDAIENKVGGSGQVTVGKWKITGDLDITDKQEKK